MEEAARMRAGGMSWAAVSKKLKRSARTCSQWSCRYRAVWSRLYSAALAERDDDAVAESIGTLRSMLRNDDDKVRRETARDLLRAIRRHDRRGCVGDQLEDSLDLISNEQLEAIIRALDPDGQDAARADQAVANASPD
jgi:hypothetical protein